MILDSLTAHAPGAGSYIWIRYLYLKILAVGYIASFLSLLTQIEGLLGPRGILPAREVLDGLREESWMRRILLAPTLHWISSSTAALRANLIVGAIAGVLLFAGICPLLSAVVCWLCYLSFVSIARSFSGFQSDGLMLETTVLAWMIAPAALCSGLAADEPPSRIAVWMMWWFSFRLIAESGLAKIRSGDPAWRDFSAMDDYYENCPFPTWIGWHVAQLPRRFHHASVAFTLFVELILPWFIPMGTWARLLVFLAWTGMQFGILLTANYTFLNYNSIAAGLFLIDDRFLLWLFPGLPAGPPSLAFVSHGPRIILELAIVAATLPIGIVQFMSYLDLPRKSIPYFVSVMHAALKQFRSVNTYALFASMTHKRQEIFFEGSDDNGETWREYRFKWQPQDLKRAPRFMAPHLPRFDWNLWFAAQDRFNPYPLVRRAAQRLLEGEECVLALFAENPFPRRPPDKLRFPVYHYSFTSRAERRETGAWWKRKESGYYMIPYTADDPPRWEYEGI